MNKKLILVFITASLFLIGCTGGSDNERSITDINVRVGIEGLTMKFLQNAPPESVFESSKDIPGIFPIAIELRNKGAFSIGDDEDTPDGNKGIIVFGFEKTYVDIVEESNQVKDHGCKTLSGETCEFEIEGKSVYNPTGNEEFITINAKTNKIDPQSETHTSTILATACYPYKTVFGSSVCVDPDIYGIEKREKACTVRDLVFEGQGAPVAITKIETRMLPLEDNKVKPQFIIYIENKGDGEVIKSDKIEDACKSQILGGKEFYEKFFNIITVKEALLSGEELDCRVNKDDPKPAVIRLRDKEDMIRCTLEGSIDASDAYTSSLRLELDYGYTFTISKDIIIEKILTY